MSTQEQEAPKVKMTMKERRMAREIKNYQQSSSNFLPTLNSFFIILL